MRSSPEPRFDGRKKPRFTLTTGEARTLLVLAALFIIGLIFQQIKRSQQQDNAPVIISGVARFDSTALADNPPAMSLIGGTAEPGVADNSHKGSQLYYLVGETRAGVTDAGDKSLGLLDLNIADQGQLESLPGIGPVLAQRIISFRQFKGPFLRVEDLLLVKGIGRKRLETLKPLVTIKQIGEIPDGQ